MFSVSLLVLDDHTFYLDCSHAHTPSCEEAAAEVTGKYDRFGGEKVVGSADIYSWK